MKHVFDVEVARKYDIAVATFLENLSFWIRTNAANGVNLYDGRYWAYSSCEAFVKYHAYLNARQIKHVIKKCLDLGLIIKGNYNKKGYDQTSWYTLTDKALIELNLDKTCLKPAETLIRQNCPMDQTKLSNGLDKIVQPIQDINKDINKDNINTPISPVTPEPEDQELNSPKNGTLKQSQKRDTESKRGNLKEEYINTPISPKENPQYWKTSRVENPLPEKQLTPTRSRSLPQGADGGEYLSGRVIKKAGLTTSDLEQLNPLGIPTYMLRDFVTNRTKYPLTETAWLNINKELLKFQAAGIDPIEQFSEMVTNNWRAISFKKYEQFTKKDHTNELNWRR